MEPFGKWLEFTNQALARRGETQTTEVESMPWYQRGTPWNVAVLLIKDKRETDATCPACGVYRFMCGHTR